MEAKAEAELKAEATPKPKAEGKKRRRRTAAQIDRKFACAFPGCAKAYGSEGSLTQHQRLKHPQAAADARRAQVRLRQLALLSAAFLPRPPARAGATLHIRPAAPLAVTLPGSPFRLAPADSPALALAPAPAPDVLAEIRRASSALRIMRASSEDAAAGGHRNLRSRSNSMPISFSGTWPVGAAKGGELTAAGAAAPPPAQTQRTPPGSARTQSQRKARGSSTPRPKSTTARRAKSRSKSESLTFPMVEALQPPRSDRSISDSTASTHEPIAPLDAADAHTLRSSWPASDPVTMDDQAIDSDILSVLASCDPTEMSVEITPLGMPHSPQSAPVTAFNPPAFKDTEDQEMLPVGLECFKIAEDIPSVESTSAMKREPFTDRLNLQQHSVGNVNVGAAGIRGGPGCLFGVPDGLISGGKVGNHSSDLELVPPRADAFGDISDAFTLQSYDVPVENDSHNLSHINSYSDSEAMDFANIDALTPIQTFHTADANSKEPGTPLQGISTKVQKLNIESEASWSEAASFLNEPDNEELLSQQEQFGLMQQQSHQQFIWGKGDPFGSDLENEKKENPAVHGPDNEIEWGSSRGSASSAANYFFGTPSTHSESSATRYFGDILMSDASEVAMMDTRPQSQVLGRNDDVF